jgi:hypothetical protein
VKPYLGGIAILPGDIVSMDIVGVLDTEINLAILRDIYIVYVQILRNQDRNTNI